MRSTFERPRMPSLLPLKFSSNHSINVVMRGCLLSRVKIEEDLPTTIAQTPDDRERGDSKRNLPYPASFAIYSLLARKMSPRA